MWQSERRLHRPAPLNQVKYGPDDFGANFFCRRRGKAADCSFEEPGIHNLQPELAPGLRKHLLEGFKRRCPGARSLLQR